MECLSERRCHDGTQARPFVGWLSGTKVSRVAVCGKEGAVDERPTWRLRCGVLANGYDSGNLQPDLAQSVHHASDGYGGDSIDEQHGDRR